MSKGQISFKFNNKVSFKDVVPNYVCVLTNKRYKTNGPGCLAMLQGWEFGAEGVHRGSIVFNMAMCHIKSTGMMSI